MGPAFHAMVRPGSGDVDQGPSPLRQRGLEDRPVKVTIHINNASHQREHAAWARRGFERHGCKVVYSGWNVPADADLVVIWCWKQRKVIDAAQKRRKPIMVMERAHLPPRMEFTSCGLNGLGNRATYANVADGGERWRKHF